MQNPFDVLEKKLGDIEQLLLEIKSGSGSHKEQKPPATPKQAEKYLQCSAPTLANLIKSGQLRSFNVGRHIRIRWEDIDEYMNRKGQNNDE